MMLLSEHLLKGCNTTKVGGEINILAVGALERMTRF